MTISGMSKYFPLHFHVKSFFLLIAINVNSSLILGIDSVFFNFLFFKRFYLFTFRVRGREREREGEKHQCVVASHMPLTGHLACNPGMCLDWELNQQTFGLQAGPQSTEPQQPGFKSAYV